jgi:signal transduction histidine kinase
VDLELGTAIDELLRNAIDHAGREAPRVALDLTVEADDDGRRWATISVVDEGPGIPDVERAVLQRGEETALMHGSGMGLWLVYWVVTELGGEVAIEDREEGGSTVTVELPLAASDDPE